ncbi:FadR/GntR family transcriptional regulator [Microlunatus sp. GCM10028923]|uniref:FadR/GntR family transcriptional regulator n=1 Tax=Microlunatus sp. GCM10028923 TaxID=3273400 RepID=UPI00361812CA
MKASTLSLSEQIADGIVALIREDGLRPGDLFRSSRELAKHFEVTTPTIREALRRLEATDVVEFRHGSGTYVGRGLTRRLLANPHADRAGLAAVLELVDARILIEPELAAAAARSRTEADLDALRTAASNALVPQRGDERPALHFHVALAAATGIPLVRETVEALLQVREREQIEIRHRYDDRERDHTEHVRIMEAVQDRDPDAAARLTREHLTAIRTSLAAEESGR